MKFAALILLLVLAGCAQLMNGQEQPVIKKKDNSYYTTCSGAVEAWSSVTTKPHALVKKVIRS